MFNIQFYGSMSSLRTFCSISSFVFHRIKTITGVDDTRMHSYIYSVVMCETSLTYITVWRWNTLRSDSFRQRPPASQPQLIIRDGRRMKFHMAGNMNFMSNQIWMGLCIKMLSFFSLLYSYFYLKCKSFCVFP